MNWREQFFDLEIEADPLLCKLPYVRTTPQTGGQPLGNLTRNSVIPKLYIKSNQSLLVGL